MHNRHKMRRAFWSLPRSAAVLAVAIGLTACFFHLPGQWNARYWRQQLAEVHDEDLPLLVRRIAAQRAEGIAALVEGLSSPRESVRREVRLALDDEVNQWQRLPQAEASERIGRLASALAAEAERIDPSSRPFVADLATRLLLWPTDGGVVDRSRLVAECEQVLRASHAQRDSLGADRWRRERDLAQAAQASADRWTSPLPVVATHERLPATSLQAPALPPPEIAPEGESAAAPIAISPRPLRIDANAERLPSTNSAKPRATRNPLRAAANRAARTADLATEQAGWSQPLDGAGAADSVETASAVSDKAGISQRESLELFAELTSASGAAAEAELTRRGFTHRQIEVGKHLTAADPEERRRWTEALPGMRGIDTKLWLLHLSRDENAEVRRAAVTLMATSQDPQMLARVAEVAGGDPDPAIRQQAARTAAERN